MKVLEEIGFDISKLMNKNEYIDAIIHDQIVRLYISHIPHIPRDTKFQPRTHYEIKACEWFALTDLPSSRKDMTPKLKMGVSPNSFFMVLPFVKRMRRWVAERNPKVFHSTRRTRHKSMGDIEFSTCKAKNGNKTISQGLHNEIQEYQQSFGHKYTKNGHGNQSATKANGCNGNRKDKKLTKRQLFIPQSTPTNNFSPIQKEESPSEETDVNSFLNFVAPSWDNFKFDRRAILDCVT
ncbi:uncharacterized protein [Epargyreus clarus]|uniref:uncharacterized protein n=1 Tax=Epargyreus clarus TaxID=520877 RepID=UPI003C2EC264